MLMTQKIGEFSYCIYAFLMSILINGSKILGPYFFVIKVFSLNYALVAALFYFPISRVILNFAIFCASLYKN